MVGELQKSSLSQTPKVVVVTGSNRGIGFGLVRAMLQDSRLSGAIIYLTSRDKAAGEKAVEDIKKEFETDERLRSHQLDINDQDSVDALSQYLKTEHKGLDVLVNNAGMAFTNDSTVPFGEQARKTVGANFFGTLRVCRSLYPLLRPGARVVNVSSSCGHLSKINGEEPHGTELRQKLSSDKLTEQELVCLMEQFVSLAEVGKHVSGGWPNSAYKVSKVGVSALTRIQQRQLDQNRPGEDVVVNHAHPGWVATDMTGHKGHWSVEKGVTSLLWAATLGPQTEVKGEFIWEDATVTSWTEPQVNLFY